MKTEEIKEIAAKRVSFLSEAEYESLAEPIRANFRLLRCVNRGDELSDDMHKKCRTAKQELIKTYDGCPEEIALKPYVRGPKSNYTLDELVEGNKNPERKRVRIDVIMLLSAIFIQIVSIILLILLHEDTDCAAPLISLPLSLSVVMAIGMVVLCAMAGSKASNVEMMLRRLRSPEGAERAIEAEKMRQILLKEAKSFGPDAARYYDPPTYVSPLDEAEKILKKAKKHSADDTGSQPIRSMTTLEISATAERAINGMSSEEYAVRAMAVTARLDDKQFADSTDRMMDHTLLTIETGGGIERSVQAEMLRDFGLCRDDLRRGERNLIGKKFRKPLVLLIVSAVLVTGGIILYDALRPDPPFWARILLYTVFMSLFLICIYMIKMLIGLLVQNSRINKAVRVYSSAEGQKAELEAEIDRRILEREREKRRDW